MLEFEEKYEVSLTTPHEHECKARPPLWIMWSYIIEPDGISEGPQIDSICNSEESARYHLQCMLETYTTFGGNEVNLYVERIPANHRFASSMTEVIYEHEVRQEKAKAALSWKYKHSGD